MAVVGEDARVALAFEGNQALAGGVVAHGVELDSEVNAPSEVGAFRRCLCVSVVFGVAAAL
jgi:hypothetical protein